MKLKQSQPSKQKIYRWYINSLSGVPRLPPGSYQPNIYTQQAHGTSKHSVLMIQGGTQSQAQKVRQLQSSLCSRFQESTEALRNRLARFLVCDLNRSNWLPDHNIIFEASQSHARRKLIGTAPERIFSRIQFRVGQNDWMLCLGDLRVTTQLVSFSVSGYLLLILSYQDFARQTPYFMLFQVNQKCDEPGDHFQFILNGGHFPNYEYHFNDNISSCQKIQYPDRNVFNYNTYCQSPSLLCKDIVRFLWKIKAQSQVNIKMLHLGFQHGHQARQYKNIRPISTIDASLIDLASVQIIIPKFHINPIDLALHLVDKYFS